MVKLVIMYKHPQNEDEFEDNYVKNLAMLERMTGIIRQQANMVLGSPEGASPFYRILELYFASTEALDSAMRSPEGVEAGQMLMAYAADIVDILFVDVFEDTFDGAIR